MTIESYYGTKLIKTSFIPTLLTDKEVTNYRFTRELSE
jgi:hypothetical protein